MTARTPDLKEVQSTALERVAEFDRTTAQTQALVLSTVVDSAQASEVAASKLRMIMRYLDSIEAARKSITAPLWQAYKATQALFDPPKKRAEEMAAHLKKEIGRYELSVTQARAEAMQQQAAGAPPPVLPLPVHADTGSTGVSTRVVWKWRITDPGAVPRELCSPDLAKIAAHFSQGGETGGGAGSTSVPGVEWYEDTVTTVRRK